MEFSIGDRVYLKPSRSKGITRFGRHGKLSPRFVGPFEVIERVGPLAYQLDLPDEMAYVHNVFHVSMLRKCLSDRDQKMKPEPSEIQDNLTFI